MKTESKTGSEFRKLTKTGRNKNGKWVRESIGVLYVEGASPDANITDASDAIWWTYVTITTVGYGDRFPVTNWGRIVGVFVMTAGVGLFGTLSGFLAQSFLSPSKKQEPETATVEAADPKARIAEIVRLIEAQEKATADLKTKLEEVKALL